MAPPEGERTPPLKKPTPEALKYLKGDTEQPLPVEIKQLVEFLDEEERRIFLNTQTLQGSYSEAGFDSSHRAEIEELIRSNELLVQDIWQFQKLLYEHAENPDVEAVSDQMNSVYGRMFGVEPARSFKTKKFGEKLKDFFATARKRAVLGGPLEQDYMAAREEMDDTLDAAQTKHLVEMAATGHGDALFETYVTSVDRYQELTDKILGLPKPERDQNVDVLMGTLNFYDYVLSDEFQADVEGEIGKAAENILSKQESQFKGLRGVIQKCVEKGMNFTINHLSYLVGDEESMARMILVKAAKAGIDLSKPVKYDPALIHELAKETTDEIKKLTGHVDKRKLARMREACVELKSVPNRKLPEPDRERFSAAFKDFFGTTVEFQKAIIETQSQLLQEAYVLSHGKDSSEFEADWTLRAKFLSYEGRDLIRLLRVYSPFGIFMPAEVERKDDKTPVHLRSAYHRGWFNEHPVLSTAAQGAELTALLWAGYKTIQYGSKLSLVGRILGKILSKPLSKIVPIAGQILLGYAIGDEINQYRFSVHEREILEMVNKYNSFKEIPENERKEIRQHVLLNELEKRRHYFQSIGYDLGEFDIGLMDQLRTVGFDLLGIKAGSMYKTGTFVEALRAANRKIVLLGFEPFEIKD